MSSSTVGSIALLAVSGPRNGRNIGIIGLEASRNY
jgi:hypothetical protein